MTTPSRRRLMRDFKKLQEDPPAGVNAAPTEDNIMVWEAVIFGPQDTPFEVSSFISIFFGGGITYCVRFTHYNGSVLSFNISLSKINFP